MLTSAVRPHFTILTLFKWLLLINLVVTPSFGFNFNNQNAKADNNRLCFCQLEGAIEDCNCNVDTVDYYNNVKIYPRLKSLLSHNYFRFYKVNLHQKCPFWSDDSRCAMKFCHVQKCEEETIPAGLKGAAGESKFFKYTRDAQDHADCPEDLDTELGFLNKSISIKAHENFQKWADYDDALDNFCILDDQQEGAEYVDLLLNPERYTGYRGDSAHRIWKTIYQENCFPSQRKRDPAFQSIITHKTTTLNDDMCLEQRAFYRLISGLHASINIHLSANYLLSEKKSMGFVSPDGIWGPNLDEFERRFSPVFTDNEGPHWLRNLYFAYLLELRALVKVAPLLRRETFFTGITEEDKEVQTAVNDLLKVVETFPTHFNESVMFNGESAIKLKEEFKEKFRNISKIMDCVGCDKCRLWGKLQIQGMGTALKILFSGKFESTTAKVFSFSSIDKGFKLKRTEIVALLNAFGRLSTSINELEVFRQQLR